MHVILIPGLWLDADSWERVVPGLERAGHRAHPVTPPGTSAAVADRGAVTLADHVTAVAATIDACDGPVVLVGHSAGCGLASLGVDARPDRVARAIYVGGFPAVEGRPVVNGFEVVDGGIAFPDWSAFDDADLVGLDDRERAAFAARAVPSPGCLTSETVVLTDERRYDVPVTAVCTEYTAEMLREWIDGGAAPVQEFARIRELSYADLPTGHWPQFSRPDDLAALIAELASEMP